MIQRVQSLYLTLSTIASVYCMSSCVGRFFSKDGERVADMYNLWITNAEDGTHGFFPFAFFVILLLASTATLGDIFLYMHRTVQMRVASFAILLMVGWYVVFGIFVYMIGSDLNLSFRPHWTAVLPAVSIVLLYLAYHRIHRDEMLVRSLDRLR